MSKHVSYRGATIDMESMRRENEKVPALGNMGVNARGDRIKGGKVTQSADDIARDKNRVQSVIVGTGLKGAIPEMPVTETKVQPKSSPVITKPKETELPNGDIVIEDKK